jgi:hypothetical protein
VIFVYPPPTKVLHSYNPHQLWRVGGLGRSYSRMIPKVLQPASIVVCRSVGG